MNLSEALSKSKPQIGQSCTMGRMLAASDAKMRAEIQAALDNASLSNAHLARAFSLIGFKLADGAVRRHRVGECRCGS